jgi:hypothetical protein
MDGPICRLLLCAELLQLDASQWFRCSMGGARMLWRAAPEVCAPCARLVGLLAEPSLQREARRELDQLDMDGLALDEAK